MASETGKRYFCEVCKAEFVVTKGSTGSLQCCGKPLNKK